MTRRYYLYGKEFMCAQYWRIIFGLVLCVVAISGCKSHPQDNVRGIPKQPTRTVTDISAPYWPTEGWRSAAPGDLGMDAEQLQALFTVIGDQSLDIDGIVVIRDGYIVAERYYPPYDQNTPHPIYSCTKSVMSALIGIALDEGVLAGENLNVLGFFPDLSFDNVDKSKESMTLEHLLTMQSGLEWEDGMPTYMEMGKQNDLIHYVLDKPMVAEPGSVFNYCSGCSHLLSIIIQNTSSYGTLAFAQERLFDPLGITGVIWELDRAGYPNGGWGLKLTPRDMAKFGYLYLHEGVWEGNQIIPAAWVEVSTRQQVALEDGDAYGYQWWVYSSYDMYAARGYQQQAIFVHPELNLVVAITAEINDAPKGFLLELMQEYIVGAVNG